MKKENLKSSVMLRCRIALLLAAAMLLPMFSVGCQSAQDMLKQMERADEVEKLAEAYMQEKYNRGFQVRKCEAAEGDQYKGDFFISFNSGVHAFYDSDEDKFYDDRQSDIINEAIMRDIWLPLFESLGAIYLNVNDKAQIFSMVYHYERGGKDNRFSMYHDYFGSETTSYFLQHCDASVTSDNIILISNDRNSCSGYFSKIKKVINYYFKGQSRGDLNVYVVKEELQARPDFDFDDIDAAVNGVIAHIGFGETSFCSFQSTVKVTDGLYAILCRKDNVEFLDGDITLAPVEDFEGTKSKILETLDKQEVGLIDKYTAKKRNIDFGDAIYTAQFSERIQRMEWEDVSISFVMKAYDGPIHEYAEMNEKQHGFFGYDMSGTEFNATCLCTPDSRSNIFTYPLDSEVYFWFGSQS